MIICKDMIFFSSHQEACFMLHRLSLGRAKWGIGPLTHNGELLNCSNGSFTEVKVFHQKLLQVLVHIYDQSN